MGAAAALARRRSTGRRGARHELRADRAHARRPRPACRECGSSGPPGLQGRIGVVSFEADGAHPHDVCQLLGARGVCLRGGHHCAQPLMDALRPGRDRAREPRPLQRRRRRRRAARRPRAGARRCSDDRPDSTTEAILEPREAGHGSGRLEAPEASVTVDNPLCGDRVTLDLDAGGRPGRRGRAQGARLPALPGGGRGDRGARAPGETPAALRAVATRAASARCARRAPRPPALAGARRVRAGARATRAGTNACCCRSRRWSRRSTRSRTPSAESAARGTRPGAVALSKRLAAQANTRSRWASDEQAAQVAPLAGGRARRDRRRGAGPVRLELAQGTAGEAGLGRARARRSGSLARSMSTCR